jgi:hypothetical protein
MDPQERHSITASLRDLMAPYEQALSAHRSHIRRCMDNVYYAAISQSGLDSTGIAARLRQLKNHSLLSALGNNLGFVEDTARLSLLGSGLPYVEDDKQRIIGQMSRVNASLQPIFGYPPISVFSPGVLFSLL